MTAVSWAKILWKDSTPLSQQFGDVYFSEQHGREESLYTFLQGINAPDIWQKHESFTLFETGFGTGLNFLTSTEMWLNTTPASSCLHFISIEGYPLTYHDLVKSHTAWPSLQKHAEELQKIWPPKGPGVQKFSLFEGRVRLTLFITQLEEALQKVRQTCAPHSVHAWYLDGFAPSKNPDMWTAELYQTMAALSHTGAPVASFTAAGHVRRGLEQAGFHVTKRPGFAQKRDSLTAYFPGSGS